MGGGVSVSGSGNVGVGGVVLVEVDTISIAYSYAFLFLDTRCGAPQERVSCERSGTRRDPAAPLLCSCAEGDHWNRPWSYSARMLYEQFHDRGGHMLRMNFDKDIRKLLQVSVE